jgi:outer membrane protein TolC
MTKLWIVLSMSCLLASGAEPLKLTLKQAVGLALKQSPEVVLARLDEQRAELGIAAVREPLMPRLYAGSGLAYTYGMPTSVDGASPAVVQARAVRGIFSRPQDFQVAQAREDAHGAHIAADGVRDEIAYKTAMAFLDLEQVVRAQPAAARESASFAKAAELVNARVAEGREREIEARRAALVATRARQREAQLERERARLSGRLAEILGVEPATRVEPALEAREAPALPASEAECAERAVKENAELRKMESAISSKQLEARGFRAMRLPKADLVAQYGLFARFNNYADYFRSFQRNNAQIGISLSVPLFANAQDEARAGQAEVELQRLRTELQRTRLKVDNAARQAWDGVAEAASAEQLSELEWELAREQNDAALAQLDEGKVTLKDVEMAHAAVEQRSEQLGEARLGVERARYEVLRQTRALAEALR